VVAVAEHYFTEQPTSKPEPGLIRCTLRGLSLEFLTDSGVFSHRRIDAGTRLLIDSMILPPEGALLDLGCGYGPIGIVAARLSPGLRVWMTDINARAIDLAEENAARNGARNVRVLRGSLYEPVDGIEFDAIVSNPPISAGMRRVVGPLVAGSIRHLRDGGSLQLVVQSNKGGRTLAGLMEGAYGGFEVLARRGGYRVLRAVKGA
jgi:16S rRNA (guanine1207-N2)-methyltransferase